MTIKLTKDVKGKKVELDLIFLNGETLIRKGKDADMKAKLTAKEIADIGYKVEK